MTGLGQFAMRDLGLQLLVRSEPAARRRFGCGSGPMCPLDECEAAV